MSMDINLTNMTPIYGYKLDKYGLSQWVIVVDKNGLHQWVIIVNILFEINIYENHEYMFLKILWI